MSEPRSNTAAPTSSPAGQKATSSRKRQDKPTQKAQTGSSVSNEGSPRPQTASLAEEETLPGRVLSLTAIDRDGLISVAAYYRSEQRNFAPGFELEDWLAAEAEIDALLLRSAETDTTPPV